MPDPLDPLLADWPVDTVAAAVVADGSIVAAGGDLDWTTRVASISKVITAYAALVAVEEGSITLDEPAGRPGATVRHLLAHAAGYDFDGPRMVADVGVRRVYSNVGIEAFAAHLEAATGITVADYIAEAVFHPLGMTSSRLAGSPAHAVHSSVRDLSAFAAEVMSPTLVASTTHAEMTSIQWPALGGVLPGIGRFDPNPWGIGAEIKGAKEPHWSGSLTSPQTYGHFGGSGTMLWVDPVAGVACIALADREFGPWSMEAWPALSDEVIRRYGDHRPGR